MALIRTTVEIHAGLTAEVTWDAQAGIGEAFVAGRAYGFAWSTDRGIQWDAQPPYVNLERLVLEVIDA